MNVCHVGEATQLPILCVKIQEILKDIGQVLRPRIKIMHTV